MKILYIGNKDHHGYSYYQYSILKKNYKNIDLIEIKSLNLIIKFINLIHWKINLEVFDLIIFLILKKKINKKYDLIYIHNESLLGKKSLIFLKKNCQKIFFFCSDNPFVRRDKMRWNLIKRHLNLFDQIIFIQKNRFKYSNKLKLKNTVWIPPTFKIDEHQRIKINNKNKKKFDVIIIATYFPERGELVNLLIKENIKIKIFGDKWHKFKNYLKYKKLFGSKINKDSLYVKLIQSSKVSICLPSVENDDDITNRSLEIPYIGTLLLAKRTKTHELFFKHNHDAILFENLKDCVSKLKLILKNKKLLLKISKNGHIKINRNKLNLSFENNIKKLFIFHKLNSS